MLVASRACVRRAYPVAATLRHCSTLCCTSVRWAHARTRPAEQHAATALQPKRPAPAVAPGVPSPSNATLRCCEIDSAGRVALGSVMRSAVCRALGVLPRDLRRLDGTLRERRPAILVRARAILVHMEGVRVIVKRDGLMLLLEGGERPATHGDLVRSLQRRIRAFSRQTQADNCAETRKSTSHFYSSRSCAGRGAGNQLSYQEDAGTADAIHFPNMAASPDLSSDADSYTSSQHGIGKFQASWQHQTATGSSRSPSPTECTAGSVQPVEFDDCKATESMGQQRDHFGNLPHQSDDQFAENPSHGDCADGQQTPDAATGAEQASSAFEFVAVEGVLAHCMAQLSTEFAVMSAEIEGHMVAIERIVHWERLRVLLLCRKRLTLLAERVSGVQECLKSVLDSDADMAAMYLSDAAASACPAHARPADAHEEVELMLEAYLRTAEDLGSRCQVLMAHMASTEDIVNIRLVGQRNALLLLDMKLSIGTFAASMGGFGASMLGMNLANGFEHAPHAFWAVLGALCAVTGLAFAATWRRLAHVVRTF